MSREENKEKPKTPIMGTVKPQMKNAASNRNILVRNMNRRPKEDIR